MLNFILFSAKKTVSDVSYNYIFLSIVSGRKRCGALLSIIPILTGKVKNIFTNITKIYFIVN